MFLTTKLVVGGLVYQELAAVGFSGDLTFEVLVIAMGLLSIVGVLCAQAEGAGAKHQAGLAVRQGMIIALALGTLGNLGIWNMDYVLRLTGQDPEVIALARPYLRQISFCVLPVLFFSVLRNYVAALSRANSVMVITLAAVGVNYVLTVWFVHGGMGITAMGVAGAGLATTLVSWLMFLALLFYVYKTPALRGYGLFADRWKFDATICKEIIVLGVPVAGHVVLDSGVVGGASILSGMIGAETLAAYQVVMAWVGFAFVIGLGVAEATMVRVAHGVGEGNLNRARFSGMLGMSTGVTLLTVLVLIPVIFSDAIINLFIHETDPGYGVVSALAAQFLVIAAIFQVFDGLQAIAARALRGIKDNIAPLWIATFGYWVMGMGGGAYLAFGTELAGAGLWWGMAAGLTITGTLLAGRFWRLTNRLIWERQFRNT